MKTTKVSAVKNGFHTLPEVRELYTVLDAIKNGTCEKEIKALRELTDKTEIRKAKERLPAVLFSGIFFGGKKDNNLAIHSGLCILDFDKLTNLEEKKAEIIKHPFVVAMFVSPSGNGLKVVCRIVDNKFTHEHQYRALMKLFPELDSTSRSLSRLCYISHDPDIYINYEATRFEDFEALKQENNIPVSKASKTNYTLLDIACKKIRYAKDGEKHAELLKASRLVGGYVAGGLIEEDEAFRVLEREILKKDVSDPDQARKTIADGIEYGKLKPLSLQNSENETINISKIIESNKVCQENEDFSFVADEKAIVEYLAQVRNNTFQIGLGVDIPEIDDHIRFKRANLVGVNGHDNVGKSNMIWYYFTLLAIKHNLSFIIFSAENKPGGVIRKIIEFKYCKALTDLTEKQFKEGYEWANEHFTVLRNEDSYTYKDILARAAKVLSKKKYDAIGIDPYNSLHRDMAKNKNTHEYDYEVLGDMILFKNHYDISIYINFHVVTEACRRTHPQDHEYEGMLMPPGKGDTEGGSKVGNRVDDFWTIHRYTQHPTDYNITQIHVRKVRETETGGKPTPLHNPIRLHNAYGVAYLTDNQINPILDTAEKAKEHNFNFTQNNNFNDF